MPNSSNPTALNVERLETREVPAILIQVDYSYDNGFFSNNPQARATIERAAAELGSGISADLATIAPGGGNTWTATFVNPTTGGTQALDNPTVAANTIKVYVGARDLGDGEAGFASTTGYTASGTPGWVHAVETRGWNGFAPWGGSIAFDSDRPWYFGDSAAGLGTRQLDFYSVAMHELGHVLGIGTSGQWRSLSQGGAFRGAQAMAVNGGPVPLEAGGLHWAHNHGGDSSLAPSLTYGKRVGWSALDAAALRDIGWASGASAGGSAGSAAAPGAVLFALAGSNGVFSQYVLRDGAAAPTGRMFVPFPGFSGVLRQAFGDVNGDGVIDTIVATTNAGPGAIAVVSGLDGRVLGSQLTRGSVSALVAVDVDGDGRAEVATAESLPRGGMGVYVYNHNGRGIQPYALVSAYGEPGRAGLHLATDDVDHDGHDDFISSPSGEDDATPTAGAYVPGPCCGCRGCVGYHGPALTAEPDAPAAAEDAEDTEVAPLVTGHDEHDGEDLLGGVWVG